LSVEVAKIDSDSGSSLATWYIPAKDAHATIILLHAIRGSRLDMLGRARLFHDAGYTVVMIDLQAHGESPGQHITVGYLERFDARAAVNFAREKDPANKIAVVGCSLGGAAAVLASPLDIDAAVLESVYPTIEEAVHNRIAARLGPLSYILSPILIRELQFRSGISPSELRPIDHMAELQCPVLVASGDADRHTTPAETERMFAAASEPKQLVFFKGAAHVDLQSYDAEQYKREVLPFLEEYLRAPRLTAEHE
jgi:fermentation-respiration switch protein FrsA (DUF1100 family)